MRVEPLGDSAFVIRQLNSPAYAIADALNEQNVPGVIEAAASYDAVGVYVDPDRFDLPEFEHFLSGLGDLKDVTGRAHLIPVCFAMGEDLLTSSVGLKLSVEELVQVFCSRVYRCYAIGFCPGFPYLGYLDDRICGLKRLQSPRPRVPRGSVAIAENQAGVYPMDHPGGWRILGRTPLQLVSVEDAYFPIKAGDDVSFIPIDEREFRKLEGNRL